MNINKKEMLPEALMKQIPALGATDKMLQNDIMIWAKYDLGGYSWLVTECETEDDDVLFYGYIYNSCIPDLSEWKHFSLFELMCMKLHGTTNVERDLDFKECAFGDYIDEKERGMNS